MSKIKQVEKWLLKGNTITQRQAILYFNYFRLPSGIHRLRKKYNIETENVYKNKVQYAKYRLISKNM